AWRNSLSRADDQQSFDEWESQDWTQRRQTNLPLSPRSLTSADLAPAPKRSGGGGGERNRPSLGCSIAASKRDLWRDSAQSGVAGDGTAAAVWLAPMGVGLSCALCRVL